jgi:hypothetical protein
MSVPVTEFEPTSTNYKKSAEPNRWQFYSGTHTAHGVLSSPPPPRAPPPPPPPGARGARGALSVQAGAIELHQRVDRRRLHRHLRHGQQSPMC